MSEANWGYDGESYCEEHLPVPIGHPEVFDGGGEQDCPANCHVCGRPLEYSLTPEGVNYVIESIKESLERIKRFPNATIPKDGLAYYVDSPHYAVVRDWAKDLQDYSLTTRQRNLVNHYLKVTK